MSDAAGPRLDQGSTGPGPKRPTLPTSGPAETRVDKWLWAVRLYKTRTLATDACRAGHVKLNEASAKPSSMVKPGDRVHALTPGGDMVAEVTGIIEKRAGAPLAALCYIDHTPPPPDDGLAANAFARDRGAGRPTKRDRRQLDRARRS